MNKTSKGALAAAAAGVLLLGGAGSLAFWSDSDAVDGGTFTAGSLNLEPLNTCDAWNLDSGEPGGQPFDPATDLLVPGDTVTKTCSFTIDATGEHLRASVEAVPGTAGVAPDLFATGDFTMGDTVLSVGGLPVDEITEANHTQTLSVEVSVDFVGASGNDSQDGSGALDAIDIETTQEHS